MAKEAAEVFLEKTYDRIDSGEFDENLSIPFASRKCLKDMIRCKINNKMGLSSTPALSEREIYECIEDVRDVAAVTGAIFMELGILEKNEDGEYNVNL